MGPLAGQPGHGSTAHLRRQPVRIVDGRAEGGYTGMFELICPDCGGDGTDVAFASHHWPTWGQDNIRAFLTGQRDLYAYLMTVTQLFDTIAIRIDGPRAAGTVLSVLWHFTDTDERYLMELSNGVLIHHPTRRAPEADLTLTLTHLQLLTLVASDTGGVRVTCRYRYHRRFPACSKHS